MTQFRAIALAALALCFCALRPAALSAADATAFIGTTTSPANRLARGFSIGTSMLIIGYEFEYSDTTDDVASGAPSLKTGSGNLLLQTPIAFAGFQPYFEIGGGIYHEDLAGVSNTGVMGDTGGGVKITLIGPVRVRVDYRVMTLRNGALVSPAHRIYAGINLKF